LNDVGISRNFRCICDFSTSNNYMKYWIHFIFLLFIFVSATANVLFSQDIVHYTEEELSHQAAFMDAMVFKFQNNDNKAIEAFEKILKQDATNHSVAFEIAKLHAGKKSFEEAIRYGEKAISYDSNNKWYLVLLSNAHMENNEFDKAIPYLNKLKSQDPGNRDYFEDLAYCYLKDKKSDQALQELNALEKIIGIDESNIKKKFDIYRAKDDKSNAEGELLKLIQSAPSNTMYLNNLASFYMKTGQKKKGKKTYKEILVIDPDDTHANLAVASELNDQNNASAYLLSLKNVLENPEIGIDAKIKELVPHIEALNSKTDSSMVR